MKDSTVYCQNCRAANSLNDSHCAECGTRLLLVIFPTSLQYDTNQTPSFYEDHLLERVSILELRQAQLSEALRGTVDLLRDQSQLLKEERDLIKELYGILGLLNTDEAKKIRNAWDALRDPGPVSDGASAASDRRAERIIAGHGGENSELLAKLVNESARLLGEGNERQGLQMLERARVLSPQNVALHLRYAWELFVADRYGKAAEILSAALLVSPDDRHGLLLSGVVNAELLNLEQARRSLSLLVNIEGMAGVTNFVWGMLAAYEGNWTECIAALKQSSAAATHAELEYLIGCAYFQLQRYSMALRHLNAAAKLDKDYADAWFMKSVVHRIQNEPGDEMEAFEHAAQAKSPGAQCHEFLKGRKLFGTQAALPFRHFSNRKNSLLSGGAPRIRRFCRDLLNGILDMI
ncbi:MAG: hypothetical protein IPN69_13305 [Acidobacteria bacterium]|nr:hypothetical protein [Acidobacteriota bacterium]MBK8148943.1 hypothetical protein [Acidobacteriota bacterium]MBK8811694.1 hypothetical protein [Acidobacteriota bacterium]